MTYRLVDLEMPTPIVYGRETLGISRLVRKLSSLQSWSRKVALRKATFINQLSEGPQQAAGPTSWVVFYLVLYQWLIAKFCAPIFSYNESSTSHPPD